VRRAGGQARWRAVGAVAAGVLAAGCLGGPQADPSAFFLLSPAPADATGDALSVAIGVGPVTLPGYLDRPQIVTRVSDNEIALAEADRWAEPLAENLARTLQESLAALLPGSSYVAYPWYAADAPDYAVTLVVRRFEADASGAVLLDASWELRWPGQPEGTRLDGDAVRLEEQADGPDRASSIAAHSRALAGVSREIAAAVRRAEGR